MAIRRHKRLNPRRRLEVTAAVRDRLCDGVTTAIEDRPSGIAAACSSRRCAVAAPPRKRVSPKSDARGASREINISSSSSHGGGSINTRPQNRRLLRCSQTGTRAERPSLNLRSAGRGRLYLGGSDSFSLMFGGSAGVSRILASIGTQNLRHPIMQRRIGAAGSINLAMSGGEWRRRAGPAPPRGPLLRTPQHGPAGPASGEHACTGP